MRMFEQALKDLMEERRPKETRDLKKRGKFQELLTEVEDRCEGQVHHEVQRNNDPEMPFRERMNRIHQAKAAMERQLLDDLNQMVTPESEETSPLEETWPSALA